MKETYDFACDLSNTLKIFQNKWGVQILFELFKVESYRFGNLKREIPGISNTMLTSVLKSLELEGIVHREQIQEVPLHVEYSLTSKGREMEVIFRSIISWQYKYQVSKK